MKGKYVCLGLAASVVLCVATGVPARAEDGITCSYTFEAWAGGFAANLAMTNHGPMIDGWTVRMTFPTATGGITAWQAAMSQDNPYDATATNRSWNAVIATGQLTAFGWTATAATTGPPTSVTVNGVAC
jgi:hypothetical protein